MECSPNQYTEPMKGTIKREALEKALKAQATRLAMQNTVQLETYTQLEIPFGVDSAYAIQSEL